MSWKALPGRTYRARVILSDPTGIATTAMIRGELQEQGFTAVQVWWSEQKLPADWPAIRSSDESDLFERQAWIQGVWSGPESEQPEEGDDWKLLDLWSAFAVITETKPTRWKSTAALFGGGAVAGLLIYWLVSD